MAGSSIWLEHSLDKGEVDGSNPSPPTNFTTKQSGDLAELTFATWCLQHGLGVAFPMGDRQPYDIIVDRNGELLKIQVKTAWRRVSSGCLCVDLTNTTTRNGEWFHKHYEDRIDGLAAYDPLENKLYYFRANDLRNKKRTVSIRTVPTRNNQKEGVMLAEQFELRTPEQL